MRILKALYYVLGAIFLTIVGIIFFGYVIAWLIFTLIPLLILACSLVGIAVICTYLYQVYKYLKTNREDNKKEKELLKELRKSTSNGRVKSGNR